MRKINLIILLFLTQHTIGQVKLYETAFPILNPKNSFITKNISNSEYLLQVYNNSKIYLEVLDSSFNVIHKHQDIFDFVNYEYITTFYNEGEYHILYKNNGELAFYIFDKSKTSKFIKIGTLFDKYKETLITCRVLEDRCIFITYNAKKKKLNYISVTYKGITQRSVYNAPKEKIDVPQDVFSQVTMYDNEPQDLSITKNNQKNYFYGNKLIISFRTRNEKTQLSFTKFLIFDITLQNFEFKVIPDSFICKYSGSTANTNYTFNEGMIYFVNINFEKVNVLKLDLDFNIIYKNEFSTNNIKEFNVKRIYKDGENNLTGNDFYLTDTIFAHTEDLLDDMFKGHKKISNIAFKVSIAVNKHKGVEYYTLGITRQTYFRTSYQQIFDMFNAPMGSVLEPTNFNYQHLYRPFFSKNNGVNFQTRYLLATISDTCLNDVSLDKYPNTFFRKNIKNITDNKADIKDIMLYHFNNTFILNTINHKNKTICIYSVNE